MFHLTRLLFILLSIMAVSALASDGRLFDSHLMLPASDEPIDIETADMNNDGLEDIIYLGYDNNDVFLFYAREDQTFKEPVTWTAGEDATAMTIGDFDDDGYNDIAVTTEISYDHYVFVYFNDGLGRFGAPVSLSVSGGPYNLTAIDINGDNVDDVAAVSWAVLHTYVSNGDGTFGSEVTTAFGREVMRGMSVFDAENDGDWDLAVANYQGDSLRVLYNDGTGVFDSCGGYPGLLHPYDVCALKLDGDAYYDLAMVDYQNVLYVYINNGDGTFADSVGYHFAISPRSICAADINLDGLTDVVIGFWHESQAYAVMLSNGDGTLAAPQYISGDNNLTVNVMDFDGDGDVDLVGMGQYHTLQIWSNDGTGLFPTPPAYAVGAGPYQVASGDFNADTHTDLVTANNSAGSATVLLNNGDGTYGTGVDITMQAGTRSVAVADVDGTNGPDLVVSNYDANSVSVSLNDGSGNFGVATSFAVGADPTRLAVADLNDDTYPDIIVPCEGTGNAEVYINNGDGTFAAAVPYVTVGEPQSVAIADVNKDSAPDFIVGCNGSGWPSSNYGTELYLNNGDGTFTAGPTIDAVSGTKTVVLADVDGDTWLDMLAGNWNHGFHMALNNGDGTFGDTVYWATEGYAYDLFADNFDGDSDVDVAFVGTGTPYATVLGNNGDAIFGNATSYFLGRYIKSVICVDVNGDGSPDLVGASGYGSNDSLRVLLNRGIQIPLDASDANPELELPEEYILRQNYPNPFNPTTTIEYSVPSACRVTVEIFNILGQSIATIVDEEHPAGTYRIQWDGRTSAGTTVSSGVYFYRVTAGNFVGSKKMLMVK